MIISTHAEKNYKIQSPFLIKPLRNLGTEVKFLILIRGTYEKLIPNIVLNWWRTERFPPKIPNKARRPTLNVSVQHCIGGSTQWNKARKNKNKKYPYGKEKSKMYFICKQHNYLLKNPIQSTKILLELIGEFIKFAGYKVQNSIIFLYIDN